MGESRIVTLADLREALSGIVDADHAGSEDGTGKWRCRCPAHEAALDALKGAVEIANAAELRPVPQ